MIKLAFLLIQTVALGGFFTPAPHYSSMVEGRLEKHGVAAFPGPIFMKATVGHTKGVEYRKYQICLVDGNSCHQTMGGRFFSTEEVIEIKRRLNEQKNYLMTKPTRNRIELDAIYILGNAILMLDGRQFNVQADIYQAFNALQTTVYKGQMPLDEELSNIVIWYY